MNIRRINGSYMDKELEKYIKKCFIAGIDANEIQTALLKQGWDTHSVSQAVTQTKEKLDKQEAVLSATPTPKNKSKWDISLRDLSASQILLYLGGLIVLIAGVVFISTNWTDWGPTAKILAIFIPLLISFIVGSSLWSKPYSEKQSIIFLTTGSLLFPLFLIVLFNELNWFANSVEGSFGLVVALLTFLSFIGINYVFRFPAWTIYYLLSFLITYYFFWLVIGVGDSNDFEVMNWLFLIPGTLYIYFAILFAKFNKQLESSYAYSLGGLVLFISFYKIIYSSINNTSLTLILILTGVIYFSAGIFIELKLSKKLCNIAYFIGAMVMIGSLLSLGSTGDIINVLNDSIGNREATGWSFIIIGIIYSFVALFISQLKKINLTQGIKYKRIFSSLSHLIIIGAIMYLGGGGRHPVYETLLLLVSLLYIFGSVSMKSKNLLYSGTIFLVIYIFAIGGEYFQDNIGWPITLFIAGLLSMGIGITTEKVRRKYFPSIKTQQE